MTMIRIEAIIRPTRFDDVKAALDEIGVTGMSVTEIRGAGKQKGYTQHYRGAEYQVNLLPKSLVIVVVPDKLADAAIAAIETAAKTGEIGDGKIFVSSVGSALRIRTGERGDIAVT
jgi:nitrogen regulatory protein PII